MGERYIELVIRETAGHLADRAATPKDLPTDVQKELARYGKNHKHDLRVLDLAGNGWRSMYSVIAVEKTENLNTPKSTIVDPLVKRILGVPQLSACWSTGAEGVDQFLKDRGSIAHTGRDATYVTILNLKSNRDLICQIVAETDNTLAEFVKTKFPSYKVPWRRKAL